MADRKTKLIVKAKDWFCNITITRIEKEGSVVYAYFGAVDVLYKTETREG